MNTWLVDVEGADEVDALCLLIEDVAVAIVAVERMNADREREKEGNSGTCSAGEKAKGWLWVKG